MSLKSPPDFCKKCHVVDLKPLELDFDIILNQGMIAARYETRYEILRKV